MEFVATKWSLQWEVYLDINETYTLIFIRGKKNQYQIYDTQ